MKCAGETVWEASEQRSEQEPSFDDVVDRLKTLAAAPTADAESEVDVLVKRIHAQPDEVFRAARIRCLFEAFGVYYLRMRTDKGLATAIEATRLARQEGDRRLLFRGLLQWGGALTHQGGSLVEMTNLLLEAAATAEEPAQEAAAWNNLGNSLTCNGHIRAALACREKAYTLLEGITHSEYRVPIMCNAPSEALKLEDYDLLRVAVDRALACLSSTSPGVGKHLLAYATLLSNCIWAAVRLGDGERAASLLEDLRGLPLPESEAFDLPLLFAEGFFYCYSGRSQEGLSRLRRVLELVERHAPGDVPHWLYVCAHGHEMVGQPDIALLYFNRLLTLNKERSFEELKRLPAEFDRSNNNSVLVRGLARLSNDVQGKLEALDDMATSASLKAGQDALANSRLATLAALLAAELGLSQESIEGIRRAAFLVNIGTIAVPETLIGKAGPLATGERHLANEHTTFGATLIRKSGLPSLELAATVARHHHERHDGCGFPDGLAGDAIAPEARIVGLCETFEAMTHARPWRTTPLPVNGALNELLSLRGTQFDGELIDVFVALVRRRFWEVSDWDGFLAEATPPSTLATARLRMEQRLAKRARRTIGASTPGPNVTH